MNDVMNVLDQYIRYCPSQVRKGWWRSVFQNIPLSCNMHGEIGKSLFSYLLKIVIGLKI